MFKLSKMALGLVAVTGLTASLPASAVLSTLGALGTGSTNISLTILDMGTTTYGTTPAAPGFVCSDVASCDTASGGSVGDAYIPGEDTWSVFRISSISVGTRTWNAGIGGEYLTGMFHGGKDYSVQFDSTAGSFTARATGGTMDIYKWTSDIDISAFSNLPTQRTGATSYDAGPGNLVTGTAANLWLSLIADDFQSIFSCVGTDPNCPTVNATTTAFLSTSGGAAAGNFDTNTIVDTFAPSGSPKSDFSLSGSPLCTDGSATCGDWTTVGTLSALGYRVPEPGSLALVGLGLMSLAGLRRRKQQA